MIKEVPMFKSKKVLSLLILILFMAGAGCAVATEKAAVKFEPVKTAAKSEPAKTATRPVEPANVISVKGKVKGISLNAHTIAVDVKNQGFLVFKLNERTMYKNAKSAEDIKAGESVTVSYKPIGADNVAYVIRKNLVKLPDGVTEISTQELLSLVNSQKGDYLLIDARPAIKYKEEHIPSCVSIPFTKLKKEGKGLLPADKDRLLIFYCGGPT
ncbi:MAG TPA: rhodanese-like domain-containing protein [Desulfobacterales bacterium]|nr:MAG: hypothetical protein DRI57_06455 [Deltaproteobacteria bacterium]HHC25377.1 rhodanese-like domain-containing protein [Desulfobacterales bacterium]